MNQTPFAAALSAAMTDVGMEVKELARLTGIGGSTVYAYKKGTRAPSPRAAALMVQHLKVDALTRARLLAAAGAAEPDDLPALAADLVSALPAGKPRELAIALLRTQVEMARPSRKREVTPAVAGRPEDYARAARKATPEFAHRLQEEAERDRVAGIDEPGPEEGA